MKKVLFILTIALFLSNVLKAQLFSIAGHDIGFAYVGPKFGTNFSTITNSSTLYSETKNKFGYQFGAIGEFGLTSSLSVHSEVTFVSKGMIQKTNISETKFSVNYLGLPLLLKYTYSILGLPKIYAMGGTYANIRTGGGTGTEPLNPDGWRRADWGLSLGFGGEYEVGRGLWCLDFRYDMGLVDVHVSDPNRNTNRTFGVTVIYKHDLVDLLYIVRDKRRGSE